MTRAWTSKLHIDAPPEQVFAALADIERKAAWMSGAVRIEPLEGEAFQPGFRFREVRRVLGIERAEVQRVVAVEANHSITQRSDGPEGFTGGGRFEQAYRLEPGDSGTVLNLNLCAIGLKWHTRLLHPSLLGTMKMIAKADLAALKSHLERS